MNGAGTVREETGLNVDPVALAGVYKNTARGIISLVIPCQVIPGQLTETDKAAMAGWFDSTDVQELADEAHAVRVLDALLDGMPAIVTFDKYAEKTSIMYAASAGL